MTGVLYILKNGQAVECNDVDEWALWCGKSREERRRFYDEIGEVKISTVFLGVNHRFGSGEPLLWETMIFGGPHDQYQERYTNEEDARIGHARAVALVRGEAQ